MRKDLLIIALGLFLATGSAAADVLATPEQGTTPSSQATSLPAKGITMAAVEKKYGTPREKRPTVGGDTPKHPPITRWDYEGFSVIFENDRVIDAVIPGAPPRVYHKDQLTPVAASAAPLPPPLPSQAPPAPEAEPVIPPAGSEIKEPLAEPEASAAPAEPITPIEPAPAQSAPASTYPDGGSALTPAEEAPQDAPPTPR